MILSADSLFLKTQASPGEYFEYSNNADSTQCAQIDTINVFVVAECDHSAITKAETAARESANKSDKKKRSKRSSSASDDEDYGHHDAPDITFSSDITYIQNCIVIAIITTLFVTSFFAVYYFCNKDLVNEILGKVKHVLMKVMGRDGKGAHEPVKN